MFTVFFTRPRESTHRDIESSATLEKQTNTKESYLRSQIIGTIDEADEGTATGEACRQYWLKTPRLTDLCAEPDDMEIFEAARLVAQFLLRGALGL